MLIMFGRFFRWLRGLFSSSPAEIYKMRERRIYIYVTGEDAKGEPELVYADPMVLYKKVMEIGAELSTNLKVARSISKDASMMHTEAIEQIRTIFGVKPYVKDQGGLTEPETLDLLYDFLAYADELKKNMSNTPTPPMETSEPSASSSAESPPTPNSSESGSTAPETPPEGPSMYG